MKKGLGQWVQSWLNDWELYYKIESWVLLFSDLFSPWSSSSSFRVNGSLSRKLVLNDGQSGKKSQHNINSQSGCDSKITLSRTSSSNPGTRVSLCQTFNNETFEDSENCETPYPNIYKPQWQIFSPNITKKCRIIKKLTKNTWYDILQWFFNELNCLILDVEISLRFENAGHIIIQVHFFS